MDKIKATEIISLAKISGQSIADAIKFNSSKKKGTAKLAYLIAKMNFLGSSIESSIPCFNYDLKRELYSYHLKDDVFRYLQTKKFNRAMLNFKSYWKGYNEEFLAIEGEHTIQDYLSINQSLIPWELENLIESEGNKNLDRLDEASIVGSILSLFEAYDQVKEEVDNEFLFSLDISNDKLEELKALFDSRIRWLGTYQEFVFLFEELFGKYWIGLDKTSSNSKAVLTKAHFNIPVKNGEVSLVSLKDAFSKGTFGLEVEKLFVIEENKKRKDLPK